MAHGRPGDLQLIVIISKVDKSESVDCRNFEVPKYSRITKKLKAELAK